MLVFMGPVEEALGCNGRQDDLIPQDWLHNLWRNRKYEIQSSMYISAKCSIARQYYLLTLRAQMTLCSCYDMHPSLPS